LARAGHTARIDHRTLAAQQIELMPERRIGYRTRRQGFGALPMHLRSALQIHNGSRGERRDDPRDPSVALRALTRQRPAFTHQKLVRYLGLGRSNAVEFDAVLTAVSQSASWCFGRRRRSGSFYLARHDRGGEIGAAPDGIEWRPARARRPLERQNLNRGRNAR